MICSLLSGAGCAGRAAEPAPALLPCPVPPPPLMSALKANEYVSSPGNISKLLKNISAQRAYAEGLEITVNCYETQMSPRESQ